MPLSHRFYDNQQIVLTSWSGALNDSEIIRFYMSLYNNGHWQPGFSEIMDLRDADLSSVQQETLAHLSDLTSNCLKGESLRLAILAPSDLNAMIARLYESFTHIPNESTKVFHHLSEALDWLEPSQD